MFRASISPLVGARMSSRPIWRGVAPSCACGDPDPGGGGIARSLLRSRSALETKPRPTSAWLALLFSGPARHRRERPGPGRQAAPRSATGPNGRRRPAPGPADPAAGIDQHRADQSALAGDADRLFTPGGERAEAVTIRATWLRPGTTTVTVGIWPRRRRGRAGGVLAATGEHDEGQHQRQHDQARDDDLPPTRERSTTTSVSELWNVFPGSSHSFCPSRSRSCTLHQLYYPNKSPPATECLRRAKPTAFRLTVALARQPRVGAL